MTNATKAQHTPGPWKTERHMGGWDIQSGGKVSDDDFYHVGTVDNVSGFPENQANAHLIAASPDLLEALDAARRELEVLGRDLQELHDGDRRFPTALLNDEVWDMVTDAIVKARGGS